MNLLDAILLFLFVF